MKDIYKIKKEEWIILRLMYLILSLDPTMSKANDIQKTIRHIEKRYKYAHAGLIARAFDLIKQEHGKLDTFNQIGTNLIRDLQNTVNVHREYIDEESKEFMQRRVFGLSNLKKPSGAIQDILDHINLDMGEKK